MTTTRTCVDHASYCSSKTKEIHIIKFKIWKGVGKIKLRLNHFFLVRYTCRPLQMMLHSLEAIEYVRTCYYLLHFFIKRQCNLKNVTRSVFSIHLIDDHSYGELVGPSFCYTYKLSSNGTKVIPVVIIWVKVILTSILLCPKSVRAVVPASTPRSLFGPNPNTMCGFTIFCYRAFCEWVHIVVKLHKRTCLCLLEIQNTLTLSRIKGLSKISLLHAILTPSILTLEVSHPDLECMFPPRIQFRLSPKCLPPDHWLSKSLPNCT